MARFSALLALAAGVLLAFDASLASAAPLARDATSAPRLEQRRRGLLEAEPEIVNVIGGIGEAYGAFGDAYFGEGGANCGEGGAFRRSRSSRRRDTRRLRDAEPAGVIGEAFGEAGGTSGGRRR